MKNTIKSIHIIIATSLLIYIIYNQRYELEFKYHIYGSTKKLVNEDFLNPTYAYLNKDKLIGIEFISTPECGEITKKYFLNEYEKLEKIIYKTNFYTQNCDSNSSYVIKNSSKGIQVTEKNGMEIKNDVLEKMMTSFNIQEFKKRFFKIYLVLTPIVNNIEEIIIHIL